MDTITRPKRDVKKSDKSLYEIMHPKLDNATETKQATEKDEWIIRVDGYLYFGAIGYIKKPVAMNAKTKFRDCITKDKGKAFVSTKKRSLFTANYLNNLVKEEPKTIGKNVLFTAIKVGKTTP